MIFFAKRIRLELIAKTLNADFILSSTNPVEDLSVLKQPDAVIKNGRWHSRESLVKLRNEAIENRSFWKEFNVLLGAL